MNAGFSPSPKPYAPVVSDELYGPDRVNVRDAVKDPSSLFHCIRHMVRVRRNHAAFGFGSFEWIPTELCCVAAYLRDAKFDKMVVCSNLGAQAVDLTLALPPHAFHPDWPRPPYLFDVLTVRRFPMQYDTTAPEPRLLLSLEPYQSVWLTARTSYNRQEDYLPAQ